MPTFSDLAGFDSATRSTYIGTASPDLQCTAAVSLDAVREGALTFSTRNEIVFSRDVHNVAIVCPLESAISGCSNFLKLESTNPRLLFSMITDRFFVNRPEPGIHSTAIIDPAAVISPTAYIGPNCFIGPNCKIGDHTILYANVSVYNNVQIGKNVIVHSGAVLGADGFGYTRNNAGLPHLFPHIGSIIIEDFVEIGANTAIDLGTLGATVIGYGTKIDNLVHIGHGVSVGKCCLIAACTSIAGSSLIGDFSNIWTGVRIADKSVIGRNSYVGMGSVVINEVPEGKKVFGNPARVIGENDIRF